MKKNLFISLIFVFCVLAGCGDNTKLLEDELNMLRLAGIDENEVNNSKITEKEELLLKQHDFAIEYFEGKYGNSEDLQFTFVVPMDNNQVYTYFACNLISDPTAAFEIDVYKNGDEFEAKDNYYGVLMKESYADFIKSILSDAGYDVKSTDILLPDIVDEEFDKNITPEEAITNGKMVNGVGNIELENVEDKESAISKIETIFREKEITGSFSIDFGDMSEITWINI